MPKVAMRALARAVDAKDSGTGDHSVRVGRFVRLLALADGWTDDDAAALGQAGGVHDVGKLGIPEDVLLAPRRLTPRERHLVELHPAVGAEMLANDGAWSSEQVEWVRHHHERPDGAGYPDALHLDAITRGAGLLALADAWDVMTSSRPYKQAMTDAEALEVVRRLCNHQWPHFAVAALEAVFRSR